MADMLRRDVVGTGRSAEATEIAVATWPHFPEEVVQMLPALAASPSPSQTAELAGGVDLGSPERSELLRDAWRHISHQMPVDQRVTVATELLSEPPQGLPDEPDLGLRLWIDVQESDTRQVLRSLLIDAELNDEQTKRTWLQAERRAEALGGLFFTDVIPILVAWADGTETSRSIFDTRGTITGLFRSEDDRFDLGTTLLKALPDAPSLEAKNNLAQWIHELESRGVLGLLDSITALNNDDIDMIERHFGKLPEIRKWRSQHKPDS
jgi:hypothetical protein